MKKIALSVFLMLIWVGASVIVSQLIIGYTMVAILGPETFSQAVWTALYSALSYLLALVLIIFVPKLIKKQKETKKKKGVSERVELGLRGLPTWTDIGLAPVGFIVYLIAAAALSAIFMLFPWFNAEEVQEVGFSVYAVGTSRLIAFLTLVVVAPIAEEIIFRGWLYGRMRKKLGEKVSDRTSMIVSMLLVSLLFGIVHLQWNVGVNVFAMSVVLCGLREITGTIYSGILMHMLKNGVAFYLLFILGL
ncbi:CPBP family intramembrane metalloprotease [Candidatus Saccharibacteria bacterium]|nr:CPBP family intramembrane metalloprotease [Candidatus Saccharibacteria bacterium]